MDISEEPTNLSYAIAHEIARAIRILRLYDTIPTGAPGATMISNEINTALLAVASADVLEILKAYQSLKEIQE